jgi:hypothetical protein
MEPGGGRAGRGARPGRRRAWWGPGLALAGLGLGLLGPAPAAAQVALGLGLHGGAVGSADADDTAPTFGAHARLRLLGFVGIEGAVDYRNEEFADGRLDVDTVPVTVSLLGYPFPLGPLQPYALAGIGWYFSDVSAAGGRSADTSDVGVHVGGGLDLRLGAGWVLHGDARYAFRDLDTDEVGVASPDADGWQVRVGLTRYFW